MGWGRWKRPLETTRDPPLDRGTNPGCQTQKNNGRWSCPSPTPAVREEPRSQIRLPEETGRKQLALGLGHLLVGKW